MKKLRNLKISGVKTLATTLASKHKSKDVVIGLVGPLGSGKTTFTKSFARKLGIKKIKSPTFIVSSVYKLKKKTFYHFDFYRLKNQKQLDHLGFNETLGSLNRILLIEWVDKFPKIRKQCDMVIAFEIVNKNLRNVKIY